MCLHIHLRVVQRRRWRRDCRSAAHTCLQTEGSWEEEGLQHMSIQICVYTATQMTTHISAHVSAGALARTQVCACCTQVHINACINVHAHGHTHVYTQGGGESGGEKDLRVVVLFE